MAYIRSPILMWRRSICLSPRRPFKGGGGGGGRGGGGEGGGEREGGGGEREGRKEGGEEGRKWKVGEREGVGRG